MVTVVMIAVGLGMLVFVALLCRRVLLALCQAQRVVADLQSTLARASMAAAASVFELGEVEQAAQLDAVAQRCEEFKADLLAVVRRTERRLTPWRKPS
ncbi:hypothetical protein [Amycolatopsis minnesotensis]